jgi:radical SAM superfamily enzyme YgiQ (UPF0313 family)
MRIKLVFLPRYHADPNNLKEMGTTPFIPPLGIATLYSFLKDKGIKVKQDDLNIKVVHHNLKKKTKIDLRVFLNEKRIARYVRGCADDEIEKCLEKVEKLTSWKNFDVIGFSLLVGDNPSAYNFALAFARFLKERFDFPIIVGGPIGTAVKNKLVESGYVDYAIHGTSTTSIAEVNTLNFCKKWERGIKEIEGTSYLKDGKLVEHERNYTLEEKFFVSLPKFDGLPMELYRFKMEMEINGTNYQKQMLVIPYFFIRGCPWKCPFCMMSKEEGFWYGEDPGKVVESVRKISKKYRTRFFFFHNPAINPTKEYVKKFAESFKDEGIYWTDCASFVTIDKRLLEMLKKAGAVRLVFGLESASRKIMRMYTTKILSLKHVKEILKFSKKIGIWTEIDMICGFPYETEEDIKLTINFLRENKNIIGGAYLNKLWLDGELILNPKKFGIVIRKDEKSCSYENWSTKPFDEIYGLRWEEKINQTERFFTQLSNFIKKFGLVTLGVHELFFLFSIGMLKKEIINKYFGKNG